MSMEQYFLVEKCPACSRKVQLHWSYCESCGTYLDNSGPRVTKTKHYNVTLNLEKEPKKEGLSSNVVRDFQEKLNTSIKDFLYQGDDVQSDIFFPLLIKVTEDDYEIIKLKEKFQVGSILFDKDLQGYFFELTEEEEALFNGMPIKDQEKHYLFEGDTLYVKSTFVLYTILNQEEVPWIRKTYEELLEVFPELSPHDSFLQLESMSEGVKANNRKLTKKVILREGDSFSIKGRKGVLFKDASFIQEPLEAHHLESLATTINRSGENKLLHIDIEHRDVDIGKKGTKRILEDIRLDIEAGTFVLILGGSGAGKTSLINAITGREKATGRIMYGETNLYEDYDRLKRIIALVPQFNLQRAHDTVFMTLKNAGQMKLPKVFIDNESLLDEHVDRVLERVNLSKQKHSLVSKLSGGELKRLSIATEYMADPLIFILDEPDSGLDGSNARAIMTSLRSIADDKKIVLLISHSPDRTSHLFDKVLVLAKSPSKNCGKLAFYGSVEECLSYFEVDELELVVEKIEEDGDFYIEKYQSLGENHEIRNL